VGTVGAWSDDLCRLIAGEGDRLVGEGERRRFDGRGVEAVMAVLVISVKLFVGIDCCPDMWVWLLVMVVIVSW
jgi:hypothetical protein